MKLWGLTEDQIRQCASEVGLAIHSDWAGSGITKNGRALQFRLALGDDKDHYRKIGRHGRRINAVCWHGFRDFMVACYRLNSDARIQTARADYRGIEDFERKYQATGNVNIGSVFEPLYFAYACNCHA